MPIICMQCALEGFVNSGGALEPGHNNFMQSHGIADDDSIDVHMSRVHPHGIDPSERAELERRATAIIANIRRSEQ